MINMEDKKMTGRISEEGINLIKSFEGCRLSAYQDSGGIWTIGYGHTSNVYSGMKITEEQAEIFLEKDVEISQREVDRDVLVSINQNQFDTLVSFTYNVGTKAFRTSTLLKKINRKDMEGAANEFEKWVKADGRIIRGLEKRRKIEKDIFLYGYKKENFIATFQQWINKNYNYEIKVDGIYGKETKKAGIMAYQKEIGVKIDGIFGGITRNTVRNLKIGDKGNQIYILQGFLYCNQYNPKGMDGIFGLNTENELKKFQKDNNLLENGVGDANTVFLLFYIK